MAARKSRRRPSTGCGSPETGLIFDLSGTERARAAVEGGMEYHRIGRDLIEELLEAMPTDAVLAAEDAARTVSSLDVSLPRWRTLRSARPRRSHETPAEPTELWPESS